MKLLQLLSAALFVTAAAHASLISCPTAMGAVTEGSPSALSFTCGSLTFDSFSVVNATGGAAGTVDVLGASYNSVTGEVSLNLNPNLGSKQDEDFLFKVSGSVTRMGLALGGADAWVAEIGCSSPIPPAGPSAYLCAPGTQLGSIADFSDDLNAPVYSGMFPNASPVYVFKDIQTGALGSAQLSEVDESFMVATPEPVSVALVGVGLVLLGVVRRRRSACRQ